MNFKNLIFHLQFLLILHFSYSEKVFNHSKNYNSIYKSEENILNFPTSNKTITYNFYCLEKNKDNCDIIKYDFPISEIEFISEYLESSAKFDIIVDDFSKFKLEDAFVTLNATTLEPLSESKFKIYQKFDTLLTKYYNDEIKSNIDFILLLNNLENNNDFLNNMNIIYKYTLFKGIVYGLNTNIKSSIIPEIDDVINDYKLKYPNDKVYNNTLICKNDYDMTKKNKKYKRIVAVGDIHGDYEKLVKILTHSKLIDENKNWIGKDSILVQVGDLLDRGINSKNTLDLMIKLKAQSKRKGGIINLLLGNHELYNLIGTFDYSFLQDIMDYGNIEKRRKAFSLNTKYGNLLRREMDAVKVIDNIIFVHAGLLSKFATLGIDNINKKVHDILMDAPYNVSNSSNHTITTDPLLESNDGLSWTRFFYMNDDNNNEKDICEELSKVFKITNTSKMVVGHNIQENGKINTFCDNKLIMIDIALSNGIGDRFGYLEIKRDKNEFWAIYN